MCDENTIFEAGEKVWYKQKQQVWTLGVVTDAGDSSPSITVTELDPDTCKPTNTSTSVRKTDTEGYDPSHHEDVNDCAMLNNLNQAPLLHLLRRRYFSNHIYTNVSNISISFNPYKWIDGLYDNPSSTKYTKDRIPHVYSVASIAVEKMLGDKRNQSVIVSGESGAGKTEACKKVMTFLAESSSNGVDLSKGSVEDKVMRCNPFLEAFGNAKTVRNDNSSRFGKFIKIEYAKEKIVGASMCHYLLEKSRVVQASSGERNYHIFYQFCKGASASQRAKWSITKAEDYFVLSQGAMTVDNVDDKVDFEEVCESLSAVGASEGEITSILELLAGILHLGNVNFTADKDDNSQINPASGKSLDLAMKFLQCPILKDKLVSRIVKAKGRASVYTVPLTAAQSLDARNALAKATYDNLFAYLISLCNKTLKSTQSVSSFIGILDIFGFEIFEVNSFEQLCINFANEKLQSLFNHTVFISEQEMYKNEGIDCAYIEFQNNQPCVDLIEKKPIGLLPVLDELCLLGRKTDTDFTYLTQINNHHRGKTKHFGVSRFAAQDTFIVKHFAGDVVYAVEGFMQKNSDKLLPDLESAMLDSRSDFIREIFELGKADAAAVAAATRSRARTTSSSVVSANTSTAKPTTIGYKFKNQLAGLYDDILCTNPHYIRCVKPNGNKRALDFDSLMVMEQLKCNGTLEMVRIRREGYPIRETWEFLWKHVLKFEYWKEAKVDPKAKDVSKACEAVFKKALPSGYFQVAKSGKVFMKHDTFEELTLWKRNTNCVFIQTRFRAFIGRKKFKILRRRIIMLQRVIGGFMVRARFAKEVKKIVKIQARIRQFVCQKSIFKKKKALSVLDNRLHAYVVGKKGRQEFLAQKKSTLKIQSLARQHRARKAYQEQLEKKLKADNDLKMDRASKLIGGAFQRKQIESKLEQWTKDAFGAASWEDFDLLKQLLDCGTGGDYVSLARIKHSLPNLRDRLDGMKTLLHVVSISGNKAGVDLLISRNADINVIDLEGDTPLHRSAGNGDTHLAVTKTLLEKCPKSDLKSMINRINIESITPLDIALSDGAECEEGSAETVKILMAMGAKSGTGTGLEEIKKQLEEEKARKAEKARRAKLNMTHANSSEREDREKDPHFQFLKVQQNLDGAAEAAKKLEEEKRKQKRLEEQEKEAKKKAEITKRQQRRTTMKTKKARPSIFGDFDRNKRGVNLLTGGNNLGSFQEGEDDEGDEGEGDGEGDGGEDDGNEEDGSSQVSSNVTSASTNHKTSEVSNVAESKTSAAASPRNRKMGRRQSAKASDTNWAIKAIRSESGYQEMPRDDSNLFHRPSESTGGRSDISNSLASNKEALFVKGRGGSSSSNAARDSSIIEEVEEEEEDIVEEVAEEKTAAVEDLSTEAAITTMITPDDAFDYNVNILKLSMFVNDMATPENRKGWYYANADGGEEGPFQNSWMHSWLCDSSLHSDTMVRYGDGGTFLKLSSLIPDCESVKMTDTNPFDLDLEDFDFSGVTNVMDRLRYRIKK